MATSRIIVKNLPKHVTEKRLREHFAQKGDITDVKLMKTPDGKSRRFAFIGFRTEKEAKQAVSFFDDTFIDTGKITVEPAKAIHDDNIARPWSKYSAGSSAYARLHPGAAASTSSRDSGVVSTETVKKDGDVVDEQIQPTDGHRKIMSALEATKKDPKLREFLEAMKPASKTKVWSNADVALQTATAIESQVKDVGLKAKAVVKAVQSKKHGGEGVFLAKTHVKFDDSDDDDEADNSEYQSLPSAASNDDADNMDTDAAKPPTGTSVSAYIRARQADDDELDDFLESLKSEAPASNKRPANDDEEDEDEETAENDDDDDENEEEEEEEGDFVEEDEEDDQPAPSSREATPARDGTPEEDLPQERRKGSAPTADTIAETGRLYVRNLPYTCTEEDLQALFKTFGPLAEVHMPLDRTTKKPKGFAYILFLMPEHAVTAYQKLDGHIFQGRLLHVLPAMPKPEPRKPADEPKSFKEKREADRKKGASSDVGWNSLFLNSDAVAAATAARLNITKGELLNAHANSSMAVRLAQAETQIITETKRYLEEAGVVLDAFQARLDKSRSTTMILVKNLPFPTTIDEVRALFDRFGTILRIIVPPSCAIALVEFAEPSEARAAFRHVAYSKFRDLPLYLEWAPLGALRPDAPLASETAADGSTAQPRKLVSEQLALPAGEGDADDVEGTSLFVKNLSFATKEEALRGLFEGIGPIRSVTIARKKVPGGGVGPSLGFGFVEFRKKEDAARAAKSMQDVVLDGHALQLKLSRRETAEAQEARRKAKAAQIENARGTKLVIRNVPFQATRKELLELISPYGQLKSLRLPKKFDGSHRGFAFVEFLTKKEASNAFEALASTHLYGRHLVFEFAKDDESLEAVREKSTKQFLADNDKAAARKRIKLDNRGGDDDDGML